MCTASPAMPPRRAAGNWPSRSCSTTMIAATVARVPAATSTPSCNCWPAGAAPTEAPAGAHPVRERFSLRSVPKLRAQGALLRGQRRSVRQQAIQLPADLLRGVGGRVALHHLSMAVDQELGEVPLDRLAAEDALALVLQPLVQRVRMLAVHLDLREQRE